MKIPVLNSRRHYHHHCSLRICYNNNDNNFIINNNNNYYYYLYYKIILLVHSAFHIICLYGVNTARILISLFLLVQEAIIIITSMEGGYVFSSVSLSVCLSVRRITEKVVNGF